MKARARQGSKKEGRCLVGGRPLVPPLSAVRVGVGLGLRQWWWWCGWDPGASAKPSDSDPKSTCGAVSRARQQFTFAPACGAGDATSVRGLRRWGTGAGRERVVEVRKEPGAAFRQREQKDFLQEANKNPWQIKTRGKMCSVAGGQGKRGAVFPPFGKELLGILWNREVADPRQVGGWRCALVCGTAELGAAGSSQEQKHKIQREIREAH